MGFKSLNILYWTIIPLSIIVGGCGLVSPDKDITSTSQILEQPEDISFTNLPLPVQKYHNKILDRDPGVDTPILTVTLYSRPYPKDFYVFSVFEDGVVSLYAEVPDWAMHGGTPPGKLSVEAYQSIQNILEKLTTTEVLVGKGKGVIVLSYKLENKKHIITCTELECPPDIQTLFELMDNAFQQGRTNKLIIPNPYTTEPF